MLQEMRKYTKSWVSSIFLGGLALSFVVWGIADVFRGQADTTVYSVGSTNVPVDIYSREFHDAMRQNRTALTPDQTRLLSQQVLDEMTMRTALDNITANLGLTATNARIQREIQQIGAFSGVTGSFDHDRFLSVINQAGYTEDQFIARSRQDLARTQVVRAVQGGTTIPPDYARAIFSYVYELRAVEYVVLTPDVVPNVAPPSEAVLAAYVKAHPERFSTPEYRSVSYAVIDTDDLAKSLTVTDKQVEDELDANRASYVVPEKRELEQIQYKTQADATAAKAAFDGGKTFDALATARNLKPGEYKLGDVAQADLDPARAAAFFALPQGGVSQPVKTAFGWALMHLTKITPGSAKSHDEIKAVVQQRLALDKMTTMSNAYTDAISGGASIEEAARKAGMHYYHSGAVDMQGLGPDGSKAMAVVAPDLLAAIFKADVGEDGDPFTTQDGLHTYALKVDGVTPPKIKPIDAVRVQATSDWIAEQRLVQLRARAATLAARATADHSMSGVIATLHAPLQTSIALNRGTNSGLFTPQVVRTLFDTKTGDSFFAPINANTFIVARVSGVAHPQPPPNDMRYLAGVNQFSGELGADLVISLAKAIQKKEGLTINQKMVDQTVSGNGSGS